MKKTATLVQLLVLLIGVTLLFPACSEPPPPSIILIAVDTLRTDALGCYGGTDGTTPHIDRWSREGVIFKNAYSQSPWTLPAFASLLTATYPSDHGAGEPGAADGTDGHKVFFPIRDGLVSAAESFQDQGYETAAYVNNIFLKEDFGFDRGFDTYDFFRSRARKIRNAETVSSLGIRWLSNRDDDAKPFFLFLHYFDPHFAYLPGAEFQQKFGGKITEQLLAVGHPDEIRNNEVGFNEWDRINLRNLYNGEVAFTDQEVGRFLDHLAASGRLDSSVVILLSDHGEEFWDHDGFEHGHTQFEELVRVPMIIRFPGKQHAGELVETPVRLMDLMPTLHAYCGLNVPESYEGRSFLDLLEEPGRSFDVPLLFENCMYGTEKKAIRSKDLKLIIDMESEQTALFDLAKDPLEQNDLAQDRPEEAARLKNTLIQFVEKLRARASNQREALDLDSGIIEDLKDLGYVR